MPTSSEDEGEDEGDGEEEEEEEEAETEVAAATPPRHRATTPKGAKQSEDFRQGRADAAALKLSPAPPAWAVGAENVAPLG